MSEITTGPTGRLITGNVLDVNPKLFSQALKSFDPQLYIKWNPKKVRGWGCWEIRRRPESKSIVQRVEFNGQVYLRMEYAETGFMNHVLDCAYLNYDAIRKLQTMDTWNKNHWWHHEDYLRDKMDDEISEKAMKEMKYNLRYNKKAMQDFMELVRSGKNPAQILSSVKWVYNNQ